MKVIVNGTFDILHPGHIALLEYASSYGDLTVAVDTDERVKQLKGSTRPINCLKDRMYMLYALRCVTNVVSFNTDEELLKIISEHGVMVKGSDYINKRIIGSNLILIKFFKVIDGYSSTQKIEDIINR